jgi:hypothetical protein
MSLKHIKKTKIYIASVVLVLPSILIIILTFNKLSSCESVAQPVTQPLVVLPKPKLLPPPPLPIVLVTVCKLQEKQTVNELANLVKSLLLTSRTRLVTLIVIADHGCKTTFNQMVTINHHPFVKLEFRLFNVTQVSTLSKKSGNIVTTKHHSGFAGLCYTFLDLIVKDYDKIISVDSDVTFFTDVALLWDDEFNKFTDQTLLAHAINDPEWNLNGYSWVRYNFGVTLWDLKRFRNIPGRGKFFLKHMLERGRKNITGLEFIAAQHWINYMCWEKPELCNTIPFNWNIQICMVENKPFDPFNKGKNIYFPNGTWIGAIHENCVRGKRRHRLSMYINWIESVKWEIAMAVKTKSKKYGF